MANDDWEERRDREYDLVTHNARWLQVMSVVDNRRLLIRKSEISEIESHENTNQCLVNGRLVAMSFNEVRAIVFGDENETS